MKIILTGLDKTNQKFINVFGKTDNFILINNPIMNLHLLPIVTLPKYEMLAFTSSNAINIFHRLYGIGESKIACIGPGTHKALEKLNKKADFMPEKVFDAVSLAKLLQKTINPKRCLYVCSKLANNDFCNHFNATRINIYTVKLRRIAKPNQGDIIVFFSPSAIDFFAEQFNLNEYKIVCLGHNAKQYLLDRYQVKSKVAKVNTLASLTETIKTNFS